MDNYLTNPIIFIVMTIVSFLQFMFILRFLFEVMRVNYHNPVCQFVVRVTNPIIVPLRIIPLNIGRFDIIIISLLVLITAFKIYFPFYFTSFDYSINSLLIASFGKAIQHEHGICQCKYVWKLRTNPVIKEIYIRILIY